MDAIARKFQSGAVSNSTTKEKAVRNWRAVGRYLDKLRDYHGWTRGDLVKRIGSSSATVDRIALGMSGPEGPMFDVMALFITEVGGSFEDVVALMRDPSMAADDAEEMARRRWIELGTEKLVAELGDEQIREFLRAPDGQWIMRALVGNERLTRAVMKVIDAFQGQNS